MIAVDVDNLLQKELKRLTVLYSFPHISIKTCASHFFKSDHFSALESSEAVMDMHCLDNLF